MKTQTIFEFLNVNKFYADKTVFKNFNLKLQIQQNSPQIIALLGSNGAGKTTLLKLLLGLESPQSGQVRLYNADPNEYRARSCIGTTPQELDFPEGLKVCEIIHFVQSHYQNPLSTQKLIEIFQLSQFLNNKASNLSGGQKRRLALAIAFIGNPSFVLLDEPTTGLDVVARKSFWQYIKNETNKTILLTTHDLTEVEKVATRLLYLQDGQITFDGTVSEFKKNHAVSSRKITFLAEGVTREHLSTIEHVQNVIQIDQNFTIESYNSDACIRELVKRNIPFENLSIESSTLEESFLKTIPQKNMNAATERHLV